MDNWSAQSIHPLAEAIHITLASESRALVSVSLPPLIPAGKTDAGKRKRPERPLAGETLGRCWLGTSGFASQESVR